MSKINGVHHLAISTGNMKEQITFFSDVLGMKLVGLYWMHGIEGAWHGFMKLNDFSSIAFVFTPENPNIESTIGVTHAGNGGESSAPGTAQHFAFNVKTEEELLAMRDRIRSHGVPVMGPIDHGMCKSVYFAGPENLTLEIAVSEEAINPKAWIDPDVVDLAGISAEELKRFKSPAPYTGEKGVKQPAYDPTKPHLHYPEEQYQAILQTPDEVIAMVSNYPDPPVQVEE